MTKREQIIDFVSRRASLTGLVARIATPKGDADGALPFDCPICGERNGSLVVFMTGNRYWCRACGAQGGPIEFVIAAKLVDERDAVPKLLHAVILCDRRLRQAASSLLEEWISRLREEDPSLAQRLDGSDLAAELRSDQGDAL